ncbi:MAG: DUF305 domain-containing protein [bacterium]|nr:DUF305 domain-containing protein [bacterium]
MLLLSFLAMYGFMYAMVDSLPNVFGNINQAYMAGLMAAPMGVLELLLMSKMYPNRKLNVLLIGLSVIAGLMFWLGIRQQSGVGDVQFVRSMIPHHAGALLMCNEAELNDPELRQLCESILSGQQAEIEQMKAIYERLKAGK